MAACTTFLYSYSRVGHELYRTSAYSKNQLVLLLSSLLHAALFYCILSSNLIASIANEADCPKATLFLWISPFDRIWIEDLRHNSGHFYSFKMPL